MQGKGRRLGFIIGGVLAALLVNPTASEAANQISGDAYYDTVQCPGPPPGYEDFADYPGLVLTGSIEGCLYTNVGPVKQTPSGVYLEQGEEVVVGSLNGGAEGTFTTVYKFAGKFAPDGAEIHGRCHHPIVDGSGTDGFDGATGRLDFKDFPGEPVPYVYRGHITLGDSAARSATSSATRVPVTRTSSSSSC